MYVAPSGVIVAAAFRNLAGIYYEQPQPVFLPKGSTPLQLGSAFVDAFGKFAIRDANLRDVKRTDWPAFLVSGMRSVEAFERTFRPMPCYSVNSSNSIVRAVMGHPTYAGVELSVSFNPRMAPDAIGRALLNLMEAANAT